MFANGGREEEEELAVVVMAGELEAGELAEVVAGALEEPEEPEEPGVLDDPEEAGTLEPELLEARELEEEPEELEPLLLEPLEDARGVAEELAELETLEEGALPPTIPRRNSPAAALLAGALLTGALLLPAGTETLPPTDELTLGEFWAPLVERELERDEDADPEEEEDEGGTDWPGGKVLTETTGREDAGSVVLAGAMLTWF